MAELLAKTTVVEIPTMGVYDVTTKTYVQMTYLEAFKDLIANHNGVSMVFPKDIYERDLVTITKAAKACNYGPEFKGAGGKHQMTGGMYYFKFYGHK